MLIRQLPSESWPIIADLRLIAFIQNQDSCLVLKALIAFDSIDSSKIVLASYAAWEHCYEITLPVLTCLQA